MAVGWANVDDVVEVEEERTFARWAPSPPPATPPPPPTPPSTVMTPTPDQTSSPDRARSITGPASGPVMESFTSSTR
jgi:hypothetical protein